MQEKTRKYQHMGGLSRMEDASKKSVGREHTRKREENEM